MNDDAVAPTTIDPPDLTIVTGAAGWLGTGLVTALTGAGHAGPYHRPGAVRGLVRPDEDSRHLPEQVELVRGDVTDPDSLDDLFAGHSGTVDVIHTAGVIHPATSMDEFDEVNHRGTANVMDAAHRHGVRRVVHVSSNSPFGTNGDRTDRFGNDEPYHPYLGYGRSKMDAELAVLRAVDAGLNAVMVRPPWFYGPHQPARQTTFFTMVKNGRFPILGDGGQMRSMTYIDNLVQGIVRAELTATDPGQGWWIADAEPYTVNEIVATVGDALRAEGIEVKPNRFRLPDIAGTVAEKIDTVAQAAGRYITQFHVLGEMNKTIAVDISAARRDLGYEPQVALPEGMRNSIRWCLDQGIEL
ncbi:NAD-dependent epimerase/dehydratase family protein [Ilumatobacter nonamiensis]|uniref:NAD-dependent epimerase/dehydratase family protein n=1 Tax=Ilumatobacter nonamiensis TaxID=467093 RepID=UPI000A012371|nr:NAD(P)-dependent oxidoreductase [Ilumatobacter nonamiensis]